MAIVVFFGSFLLVPLIGSEFVPQDDEGFVQMRLKTPLGSSLQYTDAKMRDVETSCARSTGRRSRS